MTDAYLTLILGLMCSREGERRGSPLWGLAALLFIAAAVAHSVGFIGELFIRPAP